MFSLLTIGELWILKLMGFDLIAHLKTTYTAGSGTEFYLEAFGAIAFIVGQPIVFTILLIKLVSKFLPLVFNEMVKSFFM